MLDPNNRSAALYAKAFLALFFTVSFVAGVAFTSQRDWVGIPITLCMMAAAALLWIGYFPSRSEIHPGAQVGGGLRIARVNLEPGEAVICSCSAGYAFGGRGVAKLRRLLNNLAGEAFLTDRRLIFSPYRMSMRFRPTWISLKDVMSVDAAPPTWWMGYGFCTTVEVRGKDGSTCVFWLRDARLLDLLRDAFQRPENLPESTSNLVSPEEPGLFAFIWGWGVTAGFIVMVLATEGVAGFRLVPLGLMAAALASLATWSTLRAVFRLLKMRDKAGGAVSLGKS